MTGKRETKTRRNLMPRVELHLVRPDGRGVEKTKDNKWKISVILIYVNKSLH